MRRYIVLMLLPLVTVIRLEGALLSSLHTYLRGNNSTYAICALGIALISGAEVYGIPRWTYLALSGGVMCIYDYLKYRYRIRIQEHIARIDRRRAERQNRLAYLLNEGIYTLKMRIPPDRKVDMYQWSSCLLRQLIYIGSTPAQDIPSITFQRARKALLWTRYGLELSHVTYRTSLLNSLNDEDPYAVVPIYRMACETLQAIDASIIETWKLQKHALRKY